MTSEADSIAPKVLLVDADRFPFDEEDHRLLVDAGVDLVEIAGHDVDRVLSLGRDADAIFIYSLRADAPFIEQLTRCRILARCGVGYDNIDVPAARARGIEVTYVPEYGIIDVAEHAIALLMAGSRRLALSDRAVQTGAWPSYQEMGPMYRISGRTLGLLGFGRIARQVAIRAQALGLHVLAHDPFVDPEEAGQLGVNLMALEDVLSSSDFISIHLPLNAATLHFVDEAALSKMRPTSVLINTSRGGIVDGAALVRALDAQLIAGAALDVWEREPPAMDDAVMGRPNVLITPHSAAYTSEALADVRRIALIDVVRVLHGEPPLHPAPDS